MQTRHSLRLLTSVFCLLTSGLHAQQVAQPEITGTAVTTATATTTERQLPIENRESKIQNPDDGEAVVQMSVFDVNTSKDIGYQGINTTSGSRLNTELRDTAASITPFTQEFLDDVGATSLEDVLSYAGNVEAEYEDVLGFNDSANRWASTTASRFRIRGMSGGVSRDYVNTSIPNDMYNIGRTEIASGPNAILFGLGAQGGTVLFTSLRPDLQRNTLRVQNRIGTWDDFSSLASERLMLRYNAVLMPRKLAFLLAAVYQDADGSRRYTGNDAKRIFPALQYKPFKDTTINLNYEKGAVTNSGVLTWNLIDSITGWLAAGRPLIDNNNLPPITPAGITTIGAANNDHYVFDENDRTAYNYRSAYVSTNAAGFTSNAQNTILSPASISPYDINPLGPGSQRHQNFQTWSAVVSQRVGIVDLELGYYHNRNDVTMLTADGGDNHVSGIAADPNLYIAPPGPSDTNAAFNATPKIPNPRAGQMYLEAEWSQNTYMDINDVVRLTAAVDLNLKKWGRHRLMGLLEYSQNENKSIQKDEVWADDNNVCIENSATPEGGQNWVYRRRYITQGDFKNYYYADARNPTVGFTANNRNFHSTYVSRIASNYHNFQYTWSTALALQSYWLKGKLITILGARLDSLKFRGENQSRITDLNDPRVLSGDKLINEMAFNGAYTAPRYYTPHTYTAGVVYHLTDRLSPFANYSTNVGPPRFDRDVLPTGDIAAPPKGRTTELGLQFDVLGDNKIFLRISRYDTRQLGDNPIVPNSINSADSGNLASTDLTAIYDKLLAANLITQAQYNIENVSYNSATLNTYSKGWEATINANITKNFTLYALASYSDRNRYDIFSEATAYYNQKFPEWYALAAGHDDPANPGQPLTQWLATEENTIRSKIANVQLNNSGPIAARPWKAVVTARYKINRGTFKGVSFGASMRYNSAPIIAYDKYTGAKTYGQQLLFFDIFANYRRKILGGRTTMTVQLNIKNITNSDTVTIGRASTASAAEDSDLHRVYLNDPRQIQLTTTFDF